jgi:hypothetical protein
MAKHKEYCKGEGGGFPQVRIMVWHTHRLLDGFNYESKEKTMKRKGVGVRSLAHSILGVEGRAGASG